MKVLVINCGSSTVKFQFIDMDGEKVIAKGRCDKIGYEDSNLIYKNLNNGKSINGELVSMPSHSEAMKVLLDKLMDDEYGVIKDVNDIYAVGHRLVHGGERFSSSVLITDEVLDEVKELSPLAPLHNPGCIMGVEAIKSIAPQLKNVGVFDTAFHQTIPDFNYIYAIPYKYYEQYKIRRYGFHGTSFMYILDRLSVLLNKKKEDINAIICHLGGGASVCAIKDGKSYDTSMGFTPLEGLVMESRCGDIDPSIVIRLMKQENLSVDEIDRILNKESGRIGLTGIGDFRLMTEAADNGNERAILARKIQANRTKKYVGSYLAELNRVDAIAFTGGILENNSEEIRMTISNMENLGIILDEERNRNGSGKESLVSSDDSKVKLFVIPTNEELQIAKQTLEVLGAC